MTSSVADHRNPIAEYKFSKFGTSAPTAYADDQQWPHARKAGASILLTGLAVFGGLTGTSIGGPYGSLTPPGVERRTDRGEFAPATQRTAVLVASRTSRVDSRSDRDEVVWIKDHSGLTWDQLGKVFGVSRRAVHMWANGGRLNESNARRLRAFSAVVRAINAEVPHSEPDMVRARLLQVGPDGLSVVDRLRREQSTGPTWGAPFGAERLVGATRDPLRVQVGEVGA